MIRRAILAGLTGALIGATAMVAVHLTTRPADAHAFAAEWLTLHARCRGAIEAATPVDTKGLTPLTHLRRDNVAVALSANQAAWHGDDDRVALVYEAPAGTPPLAVCRVHMTNEALRPHRNAVNAVLFSLLEERSRLMAEGTHFDASPDPITPGFVIGYETVQPNNAGCSVMTIAIFDAELGITQLVSAERQGQTCRATSGLDRLNTATTIGNDPARRA